MRKIGWFWNELKNGKFSVKSLYSALELVTQFF